MKFIIVFDKTISAYFWSRSENPASINDIVIEGAKPYDLVASFDDEADCRKVFHSKYLGVFNQIH